MKRTSQWEFQLERGSHTIFYTCIYIHAYASGLEAATGFRFERQRYIFAYPTLQVFLLEKEQRTSARYFMNIIETKRRLTTLYRRCTAYRARERALVKKFTAHSLTTDDTIQEYDTLINTLVGIFTHLTVIPILVLKSIDNARRKGEDTDELRNAERLFLPFRESSRNPLQKTVLAKLWKAVAHATHTAPWHDVSFCTIEEVRDALISGRRLNAKNIQKRKRSCIFEATGEELHFRYGEKLLGQRNTTNVDSVKGQTAFLGLVRGRACMVNRVEDMKKFRTGDIIVSVNATPALNAVLKRAAGIVTNEGGLIAHAAIIAREYKIPCIVGTRNATRVFRDGEMLELNATNGVVQKIKSGQ